MIGNCPRGAEIVIVDRSKETFWEAVVRHRRETGRVRELAIVFHGRRRAPSLGGRIAVATATAA
jgi:hypothetical protein